MNFKADWSFLEKISMGAVSSKEVVRQLNSCGHNVIELERYSTSNKIWSTKIKRLRLPDLICLKCGCRIESRAKSKLDVRMSDNENNPDRRWDAGLGDHDVVAFIQCSHEGDNWFPGSETNYFEARNMRASVGFSKLGPAKSAGEGAERDRIWPTCIPKKNGTVKDIIESDEKYQIKLEYEDGSKYTYSLKKEKGYHVYCSVGDIFKANEYMIAGAPDEKKDMHTCSITYNFLNDLSSDSKEVRYAGVKALGYLEKKQEYVDALYDLKNHEQDDRIKLEIYSSLIRLGEDLWDEFYNYAMNLEEQMYRFEYVLILGELSDADVASDMLCRLALDSSLDTELRSAAAWGIAVKNDYVKKIIEISSCDDDNVAAHAIAHIIENYDNDLMEYLVESITDDISGGIVLKILTESEMVAPDKLVNLYSNCTSEDQKKWCSMIIGLRGKDMFASLENAIELVSTERFLMIKDLWNYSESSVDQYRSGAIDFLRKQSL